MRISRDESLLWIKITDPEILPFRQLIQFLLLKVGRDSRLGIFSKVGDCCVDASADQKFRIEAATSIHVDVLGLPHRRNIPRVADQVQQQTAMVERLEIVRIVGHGAMPKRLSKFHFMAKDFSQLCVERFDDLPLRWNLGESRSSAFWALKVFA